MSTLIGSANQPTSNTAKPPLPHGWSCHLSKSIPNRCYYFNRFSGDTTWDLGELLPETVNKPSTTITSENAQSMSTPQRDQQKPNVYSSWPKKEYRGRECLGMSAQAPGNEERADSCCGKLEAEKGGHVRGKKIPERGMSESQGSSRKYSGVRNPRQGRRKDSSREMLCSKRRSEDRNNEVQRYVKYVKNLDEKSRRLAEKRKYEEDRLEQVKHREDEISYEEKLLNKHQSVKDINRRIKHLEDERLKREKDMYLNEKELVRHLREEECLRNEREMRLQADRGGSPSCLQGKKGRLKHRGPTEDKDDCRSISVSALSFFTRRFHETKPRSPSVPKSVRERLGTIVSDGSRLGNTSRGPGNRCGYCGANDHAQATAKERKLYCAAFGTTCVHCGKMNHFAKMCRN